MLVCTAQHVHRVTKLTARHGIERCQGIVGSPRDDSDRMALADHESEVTAAGITETEMGQTLLNGNNIAMVRTNYAWSAEYNGLG